MIELDGIKVISFDCYGTLIDWETGLLDVLKLILGQHGVELDDTEILEKFAEFESEEEKKSYRSYRKVLHSVMQQFGMKYGFFLDKSEENAIVDSIQMWQPFDDTVVSLQALQKKYKLSIITNIDNDLFAGTFMSLGVNFEQIITSENVKSYKPDIKNFEFALENIGVTKDELLHVSVSLYHDIMPAESIGVKTVWINRRHGKEGSGATPRVLKKPDYEFPDLKTFVIGAGIEL
ncbi:haloacid dehalogenase type II [candidate division KSB1 bacterium]